MSDPQEHDDGPDEDSVLVAEYVLGLLDPEEREKLRVRLVAEPELRRELALWQSRLARLDTEFEEKPAPERTLPAIEEKLFGKPARSRHGLWESLTFWRSLAGAAALVAIIAVGTNFLRPPQLSPSELAMQLVAALEDQGSGVSFVALYDEHSGMFKLTALSGAAVPDKDFELWMIGSDGKPVSMGVVPMSPMEMPVPDDMKSHFTPGTMLTVTLEPKGGSPTGDPTGPVVAKGEATLI
ncbi:anti-sigma factor [Paradevosia shaoguanensis]|uniref:anti-sigma factor n=1 Tax=Paradevosia shaoguanensis TaxID=1335043 RepID=UPI0019330FB0|nr:anti-sigma factor [Paradevosia shaoguanensis]